MFALDSQKEICIAMKTEQVLLRCLQDEIMDPVLLNNFSKIDGKGSPMIMIKLKLTTRSRQF